MTVFVIQRAKPTERGWVPDLSPAAQHGRIEFIFDAHEKPGLDPFTAMKKMRRKLAGYRDGDCLVWLGGDHVALGMAFVLASQINQGKVRFLRWDRTLDTDGRRSGGHYIPVDLNFR